MKKLAELVNHIDPKWIEKHFPTIEWSRKHQTYKDCFQALMRNAQSGIITPELILELESLGEKFKEIYLYLDPRTELADKARLNEMVMWMEAECLERGIYLAALAKDRKAKEPYYTQMQILPAHACLQRYRQSYQIDEWVRTRVESIPSDSIAQILASWKSSFLAQLSYFATEAFNHNPEHNHARYHKVMSLLLVGRSLEEKQAENSKELAKSMYDMAYAIMSSWKEPINGIHFMQATYLNRALAEFSSFKRLSAEHPVVRERLQHLSTKAAEVKTSRPDDYYSITPYLVTATRAASIVGAAVTSAYALGVDVNAIRDAVNDLWIWVTQKTFNDQESAHLLHAFVDTGGMSSHMLAVDTGGMVRQLLAIDTGGVASTVHNFDFVSYMV